MYKYMYSPTHPHACMRAYIHTSMGTNRALQYISFLKCDINSCTCHEYAHTHRHAYVMFAARHTHTHIYNASRPRLIHTHKTPQGPSSYTHIHNSSRSRLIHTHIQRLKVQTDVILSYILMQIDALRALIEQRSVIVSAPTGIVPFVIRLSQSLSLRIQFIYIYIVSTYRATFCHRVCSYSLYIYS
jgi:hypothetical protein